jgi:hypothetical protein
MNTLFLIVVLLVFIMLGAPSVSSW